MRFDELGLAPEILRAITEEGYTNPTPIQAQAKAEGLTVVTADRIFGEYLPNAVVV